MKIKEIISWLETFAPISFQESYDNAGLIIGDAEQEVNVALVTLDVTPEVVQEASSQNIGLIIAHHPIIFKGLKKLTGQSWEERAIMEAVRNNIAVYAAHTNLDAVMGGVNSRLCQKLKITEPKILRPLKGKLCKLVSYIPINYADKVRTALFNAGAGTIGKYDQCSFNMEGIGTFRGGDETAPFSGEKGKLSKVNEIRMETIFPDFLKSKVIQALLNSHPYEEVAYDIYLLENEYLQAGMGMIGELREEWEQKSFLELIKKSLNIHVLKHTNWDNKKVRKVAVCGGTGSFLLPDAIQAGADAFITGDFKYHEYFAAEQKLMIVDVGHYESEHLVKEIFHDLLIKKFPTFAVRISKVNTNPVNYY